MGALLLMVSGCAALGAPGPKAPEKQVSEKVIQVWKDAGAEVCWVAPSGLWDDKPTPGCHVGFYFHEWFNDQLKGLPAPEGPFHLQVSYLGPKELFIQTKKNSTDEGMKELIPFQNFQSLDVFGENITDVGAKEIAKLKNLQHLRLSCSTITEIGLKELAKLPSITRFSLGQMAVTDEMFKEFPAFKSLKQLSINHVKCPVPVDSMKQITQLKTLEELSFFEVLVTDAGAKELGQLKNLKKVDFLNTKVTKTGEKEMQKLLPKCKVSLRKADLSFLTFPPELK